MFSYSFPPSNTQNLEHELNRPPYAPKYESKTLKKDMQKKLPPKPVYHRNNASSEVPSIVANVVELGIKRAAPAVRPVAV